MRKLAAILFLAVLLFNSFGYRFVLDYIQNQQNKNLEVQLDKKEYDATTLLEIRVAVTLPYQTNWKNFERVNGEIEVNGIHYKYVERKLQSGEMIYKCIADERTTKLQHARDNFFKLVNDLQAQSSNKKQSPAQNHSHKTFSFDYCEKPNNCFFQLPELQQTLAFSHITGAEQSAFILSPEQPPEA